MRHLWSRFKHWWYGTTLETAYSDALYQILLKRQQSGRSYLTPSV